MSVLVKGFDCDESSFDRDESGEFVELPFVGMSSLVDVYDCDESGFDHDESGEFMELPFVVCLTTDFVTLELVREPSRVGLSVRFDFTLDLGLMLVKLKISASVASSSFAGTGVFFSCRILMS